MAVLIQTAETNLEATPRPTELGLPQAPTANDTHHGDRNGGYHLPQASLDALRTIVSNLITEDDTPVDNLFSEKQQRLLTESLFASWQGPGENRPFLVTANVGMYYHTRSAPLVPDVLLSIDVQAPDEL